MCLPSESAVSVSAAIVLSSWLCCCCSMLHDSKHDHIHLRFGDCFDSCLLEPAIIVFEMYYLQMDYSLNLCLDFGSVHFEVDLKTN